MERPPSSGRFAVEERALRPTVVPNGNLDSAPDTVGEDVDDPGDPHGFGFAGITPSPWSGWPAEWATPRWGNAVGELVDVAWMCLDLNSSVCAAMPPYLVGAAQTFPNDWLSNPDPDIYTSWWEFFRTLVWDYALGEAFILCTARNRYGYPARFHVIEPWMVNAEMVRGLRKYTIGGLPVSSGPGGDLLHLRYKSAAHDAHGHGPLESGRYRLIAAAAMARYAATVTAAGGIPPGILEGGEHVSAAQASEIQQQWHNAERLGLVKVTFGGVKWRDTVLSPKDLTFAEVEAMNGARIASMLRTPPFLVGLPQAGQLVYSNASQSYLFHWRAHLRAGFLAPILSALSDWLTPGSTTLEVNRDEYVAPDPSESAAIAAQLHAIQETDAGGNVRFAMTVDEIRAAARLDRLQAGTPSPVAPAELIQGVLR